MQNPMHLPNIPSELKEVINCWNHLPEAVRAEILKMARQKGAQ